MKKKSVCKWMRFAISCILCHYGVAQTGKQENRIDLHFQQTIVGQYHPPFHSPYEGQNSLVSVEPMAMSLTTTAYFTAKLWKGAILTVNPEIAAGKGLSHATGIAGFTNGETFRIGNPSPQLYLARMTLSQVIAIGNETEYKGSDFNRPSGNYPKNYVKIVAGKFCLADYFDANTYSHDPRTQFLNWSLMSAGAYDYAANTRGYTVGVVVEYVHKNSKIRAASALLPTNANGPDLDFDLSKARSWQVEAEHQFGSLGKPFILRTLAFLNQTKMGSYQVAEELITPDITATRQYGRKKWGIGVNFEKAINAHSGYFGRVSWNDGNNETWAFTEIDESVALGFSQDGYRWKRADDTFGMAVVMNGLSVPHQEYQRKGGNGFMIGDGRLNYAPESIIECYYRISAWHDQVFLSPDIQYVINPAYNQDRGPVVIFALRLHQRI